MIKWLKNLFNYLHLLFFKRENNQRFVPRPTLQNIQVIESSEELKCPITGDKINTDTSYKCKCGTSYSIDVVNSKYIRNCVDCNYDLSLLEKKYSPEEIAKEEKEKQKNVSFNHGGIVEEKKGRKLKVKRKPNININNLELVDDDIKLLAYKALDLSIVKMTSGMYYYKDMSMYGSLENFIAFLIQDRKTLLELIEDLKLDIEEALPETLVKYKTGITPVEIYNPYGEREIIEPRDRRLELLMSKGIIEKFGNTYVVNEIKGIFPQRILKRGIDSISLWINSTSNNILELIVEIWNFQFEHKYLCELSIKEAIRHKIIVQDIDYYYYKDWKLGSSIEESVDTVYNYYKYTPEYCSYVYDLHTCGKIKHDDLICNYIQDIDNLDRDQAQRVYRSLLRGKRQGQASILNLLLQEAIQHQNL